jgi:20S proteasome alpha/beta subunit
MGLVLAIKNKSALVVASDLAGGAKAKPFGQLIPLKNRTVLLIAGNLAAVEHAVTKTFIPKLKDTDSAAAAAQILQAALVVEIVPKLDQLKGRVEFIVAGIDPIRHVEQPSLYYLDSAQEFHLETVDGDAAAAGSTAAISSLLAGHSYADASVEQLKVLAKECLAATKLRWPAALATPVRLAVITSQRTQLMDL